MACTPPKAPSPCTDPSACDAHRPCARPDAGPALCACDLGFEDGSRGWCVPSFTRLRFDGAEAQRVDVESDAWDVEVSRDGGTMSAEVATAALGVTASLDGTPVVDGQPLALPFPERERRTLTVELRLDGGVVRTGSVLARRESPYRMVTRFTGRGAASVALTGDGRTVAAGFPQVAVLSSHGGGTVFTAQDDGGLDLPEIGPGDDVFGWTVALSDDARVLASANPASPRPLSVFERAATRWEPVLLDGLGDRGTGAIAMSRDGRHVLFSAGSADGGLEIVDATPTSPGRWSAQRLSDSAADSLAITADGRTVVAGFASTSSVLVLQQVDGGFEPTAQLQGPDGGFGSSLALSDDGSVLVVSRRPGTAFVFERADGGYAEAWRVEAPRAIASVGFEAPVAVSADGSRVAVGLPGVGVVAVAERRSGAWSLLGWVHLPRSDSLAFGNGVALSADGRRLAVASPLEHGPSGLLLFDAVGP